jgi:small subunit ribosomal protein S3
LATKAGLWDKINPTGFRLSVSRNWIQPLVRNNDFAGMLAEDIKVREYLKAKLKGAVSRVLIDARQERRTRFSRHVRVL